MKLYSYITITWLKISRECGGNRPWETPATYFYKQGAKSYP